MLSPINYHGGIDMVLVLTGLIRMYSLNYSVVLSGDCEMTFRLSAAL